MAEYNLSIAIGADGKDFSEEIKKLTTDLDKFKGKIEKTTSKLDVFSDKLKGIGDKCADLGSKLTSGLTTPIFESSKLMIDAASDYEENLNKISVAFGDGTEVLNENAQAVMDWCDTATERYGLSKNQAMQATSLYGDMGTAMGLTQQEASNMATSLSGLAGDLSSFKNIDIDQAMTALNGVFTGETESLKMLGVVMNETSLEEYALANGITKTMDEMSQAEKVQLRYNYVMDATKNAHNDYKDTSTGTANSMRTLQASVENLMIAFGQHLLPIFTPIIHEITSFVKKLGSMKPETQQLILKIAGVVAAIGPMLTIFGTITSKIGVAVGAFSKLSTSITAAGGLTKYLGGMFGFLSSPIFITIAAITALVAVFALLMANNEDFRNSMMEVFNTIVEMILPVFEQFKALVKKIIDAIVPLITQFIDFLVPILIRVYELIADCILAYLPIIITVIETIMQVIDALIPPIMNLVEVIMKVVMDIIDACMPIIEFIAQMIQKVMEIMLPIVQFIADLIADCMPYVTNLIDTFSSTFSSIWEIVKDVMGSVGEFIGGIFTDIETAWDGLTEFVDGIFTGIENAVTTLIDSVKGAINWVIDGINSAIDIINKIPGVEISPIQQLLHGTDSWNGGFAYMNEGGRGELTYLPNGAQVIPHDISVRYAKESARANATASPLDIHSLGNYIVEAVSKQGLMIASGVSDGIGKMKMVANDREIARFNSSLGFKR